MRLVKLPGVGPRARFRDIVQMRGARRVETGVTQRGFGVKVVAI